METRISLENVMSPRSRWLKVVGGGEEVGDMKVDPFRETLECTDRRRRKLDARCIHARVVRSKYYEPKISMTDDNGLGCPGVKWHTY